MSVKKKKVLLLLLLTIIVGVAVYSATMFLQEYQVYHAAKTLYNGLATGQTIKTDSEGVITHPCMDFTELQSQNADVFAWISGDDMPLDYPVVQGKDNTQYLRHLMDGTYNILGTIFMDYRNQNDLSDDNSVIYGHHFLSGEQLMFAAVAFYADEGYYEAHPTMNFYTPTQDYIIEIFAGHISSADVELPAVFEDEAARQTYIDEAIAASDFVSSVVVEPQDHLITLVTCDYDFYNARYLLFGRLVPVN